MIDKRHITLLCPYTGFKRDILVYTDTYTYIYVYVL